MMGPPGHPHPHDRQFDPRFLQDRNTSSYQKKTKLNFDEVPSEVALRRDNTNLFT